MTLVLWVIGIEILVCGVIIALGSRRRRPPFGISPLWTDEVPGHRVPVETRRDWIIW